MPFPFFNSKNNKKPTADADKNNTGTGTGSGAQDGGEKSLRRRRANKTAGKKMTDKSEKSTRRKRKPRPDVTTGTVGCENTLRIKEDLPPSCSPAVVKWVERALNMGVPALREEYRGLAKYTMEGMTTEAFNTNQPQNRNRYQDVPCQDQNRVVLKAPPAVCDYVHANYVGTPVGDKRFICTQGPLDNTISEFWWLVWQQKAEQIIMLCNCIETGKYKCAQYWPENAGEKKNYCNNMMLIENTEQKLLDREPSVRMTMLRLTVEKETRNVRHLQWLDWPDRGVPPCRLTSMELLSTVRGSKAPIVVHCSAGIGRTGTIVAIEYILEKLSANIECMAMGDLMKEIRNQRAYSIQNDLQYLYIHRVMLCYFLEKYKEKHASVLTDENQAKYKKFIEDYNAAVG